jgi:hypothetical protein
MTTTYRGFTIEAIYYGIGDWRARASVYGKVITYSDLDGNFETDKEAVDSCKGAVDKYLESERLTDEG